MIKSRYDLQKSKQPFIIVTENGKSSVLLAKILYTLRSLLQYKFGEILCEQSKVWTFALWWAPFVQIM